MLQFCILQLHFTKYDFDCIFVSKFLTQNVYGTQMHANSFYVYIGNWYAFSYTSKKRMCIQQSAGNRNSGIDLIYQIIETRTIKRGAIAKHNVKTQSFQSDDDKL